MAVVIEEATEVSDELVEAFARLAPQLSTSSPPPDEKRLGEAIDSPVTTVLIARDEGRIVGTLTVVVFPIPAGGRRAWIEDVIVDEASGGKGIGKQLTNEGLRRAKALGATTVDLTSRPSREVANGMYKKLGFEQRETNVYRYTL